VWGHCRDHVGSRCGSAVSALACQLPKEYLAALHKRNHEAHAADNAFVAGLEESRVPSQHICVGGVDMQREAGIRSVAEHGLAMSCTPCSRCLDPTDGRLACVDPPLDGEAPHRALAGDMHLRIQGCGFERLATDNLLVDRRMVS